MGNQYDISFTILTNMPVNMKKMFNGLSVIIFATALLAIFITPSCKKKDTSCKAIITVVDTNGTAVADALVLLYVSSTTSSQSQLSQSTRTDASGKASFSFKLEATWDIDAALSDRNGKGIITLKPGETVEKTVTIK